jgi:hypothetical protein
MDWNKTVDPHGSQKGRNSKYQNDGEQESRMFRHPISAIAIDIPAAATCGLD